MSQRHWLFVALTVAVTLAALGCSEEQPTAPNERTANGQLVFDPQLIAKEIIEKSGWAPEDDDGALFAPGVVPDGPSLVQFVDRQALVGDVVHYSYQIQVGPGPYDVIGLHRVVREPAVGKPARSQKSVMLLHGANAAFNPVFLAGAYTGAAPDGQACAIYLAQNGVDVWGMDERWVSIPQGLADFSFMADWGIAQEIADLETALAGARETRRMTGNGNLKMHFLGYSRGASAGYAYLNYETQLPPGQRQVAGFIPVDGDLKTGNPDFQQARCQEAANLEGLLASGVYQEETGVLALTLWYLAMADPSGTSPIFPPFTNYQVPLFLGANTWYTAGPGSPPWYHFVAGIPGPGGIPSDLIYTSVDMWFDFLGMWYPYEPNLRLYEIYVAACDATDSPYDDYLGDITVPVFYVGAAGGLGQYGVYNTTLLGSTDVSAHIVSFQPPENALVDIGHVDMFTSAVAEQSVWHPILTWIEDHSNPGDLQRQRPKG